MKIRASVESLSHRTIAMCSGRVSVLTQTAPRLPVVIICRSSRPRVRSPAQRRLGQDEHVHAIGVLDDEVTRPMGRVESRRSAAMAGVGIAGLGSATRVSDTSGGPAGRVMGLTSGPKLRRSDGAGLGGAADRVSACNGGACCNGSFSATGSCGQKGSPDGFELSGGSSGVTSDVATGDDG
jgi:hypothetical protein